MEFWGVEVKSGVSLHVEPGEDMLVHISLVALGENKKNENDPIRVFLKAGEQKLIIGTLSHEKFPQLSTEIVLEKGFELSHSWRNGSVYFSGYKVDASDDLEEDDINNAPEQPAAAKQVNFNLPKEDGKDDESDDDSDEESSDDDSEDKSDKKVTAEAEVDDEDDDSSDSDEDDDDSSEDEDTPKKAEESKKRSSAEANTSKSSTSNKKAKFVTPQKTETKKPPHVHVATPHPAKGKNSGSSSNGGEASTKETQTPKSGGTFGCKSCNRSFGTEMGLQSHTKAKHSAAA